MLLEALAIIKCTKEWDFPRIRWWVAWWLLTIIEKLTTNVASFHCWIALVIEKMSAISG